MAFDYVNEISEFLNILTQILIGLSVEDKPIFCYR